MFTDNKTTTLKKICNRLPIGLIPKNPTESKVLSAISQLKTERNNALYCEGLIIAHNKKVMELIYSNNIVANDFLINMD